MNQEKDLNLTNQTEEYSVSPDGDIDIFENSKGDSFVKQQDKYEDIKSSSYTMLFVGLVGIILLTLVITKVINLPINNATSMPLFYIVLGCAFVIFIVGGFISLVHSKKVLEDAEIENKLIDDINTFSKTNITKDDLDKGLDLSEPEELLYFSRFEKIKDILMHEYENADEGLIDYMSENIYQDLYEKQD